MMEEGSALWENGGEQEATVPNTTPPKPVLIGKVDIRITVKDATVELEGTKDTFVSYLVVAQTDLPQFSAPETATRRRFTDFTFLRDTLSRDFPAAVVPPLPDKHRMEYLTGDRFSAEFIERRRVDLQRFLERVARHPKLSTTQLFQNFLESTEWNVYKHKTTTYQSETEKAGLFDNISETLVNAFAKLRKPDERFVEIRQRLDQFDESLASIERLGARNKGRLADLSGDYDEFAGSFQGLGYLESGITEYLHSFERLLIEFGHMVKHNTGSTSEPFLEHLHSLIAYSSAFKTLLKMRDQKQLEFEELSGYLSNVVSERSRLVGGYGYGLGIGSYIKERVDSMRGESELSREGKIAKLDQKIKQLEEAVSSALEVSQAFNKEVLFEHAVFQMAKRIEMKELLIGFAQGQIDMYKASMGTWDRHERKV